MISFFKTTYMTISELCDKIFIQHKNEKDFTIVWTKSDYQFDQIQSSIAIQKMVDDGVLVEGRVGGTRKTTLKYAFTKVDNYSEALNLSHQSVTIPKTISIIDKTKIGKESAMRSFVFRNKDALIVGIILTIFGGLIALIIAIYD